MKKLFAAALFIMMGLMSLFPVGVTNPELAEAAFIPQASAELAASREWMMLSQYGSGIGASGLVTQDLDGDGTVEIAAGANSGGGFGSDDYWYVLRLIGPNAYGQVWMSDKMPSTIQRIAAADVDNDGTPEIFIGLADASVRVYRGTDLSNPAAFPVKYTMGSLLLADVDGNGDKEMIISNGTSVTAYDPRTYQLLWDLSGYGGDLAVGNVDTDPTPEIVVSTGYVLDGATRAVEWYYAGTGSFGAQVEVGDIDGDGIEEIAGAAGWNKITVFEADLKSPMWEIPTSNDIATLTIADSNGDQRPEILYGDGQWGYVHCVDGQTHKELWKINNPEHGITAIAVRDVDQDQLLEVLWGAGHTSTGPDYFYVADILSGKVEWQSDDIDGPFYAVDTGDVDDDGQAEIVMASFSSNSGYADSVIKIFNATTHAVEWQTSDVPNIMIWEGINSIRIGDVDQDGETEFVIATAHLYDGLIQVYNGRSHTLERQSQSQNYKGTSFTAMEIGDVDGDGQTEIVVGQKREHTGATGDHVIVFNGATALEEWQSIGLGAYWGGVYDIDLKDVDGDGRVEIIASLGSSGVYVFDGVTHVMDAVIPTQAAALTSADVDQDGTQSILVGRGDGKVESYNGKTYALESTISLGSSTINCLSRVDIDQNGVPEWLVCDPNRLSIYSTEDRSLLWQSGDLVGSVGSYNQAPTGQIDADKDLEIVVGSVYSLYQYNVPRSGPLGTSSMTVTPQNAEPGDTLTFTIQVLNQGEDIYPNVQVENPLPAELSYVPDSLTATSGTAAFADGKITWNGDLEAHNSVTLSYQANVNLDAPRAPLVNKANVTAGGQSREISAEVTINLLHVYLPACSNMDCASTNYLDAFDNPSSGWLVSNDAYMQTGYSGGEYRFLGKQPSYLYLVKAPTCKRQNYSLEVDARWASSTTSSYYGLVFGLADDFSQYYFVMISPNYQEYSLYYYNSAGYQEITTDSSSAIRKGTALNHIKVTRNGDQISLDINGVRLGTWMDARISGLTNVGLVNLPDNGVSNADARFDNFSMTALRAGKSSPAGAPELAPSNASSASDQDSAVQPFLVELP